eukprot:1031907-Rhodomonas_salina.1
MGSTACEASNWISRSAIACKVPGGAGDMSPVIVTIGYRFASTLSGALTYNAPSVESVSPSNLGSVAIPLTVEASNLATIGISQQARHGQTSATSTSWVSESSISALAAS